MSIPVGFLHTSPAAIPPLMQFYGTEAPDLEVTNQLDDGLLRLLAKGDLAGAERRLGQMLAVAKEQYGARAALVTCSAVTPAIMESLSASAGIPLLKIDNPMAEEAVCAGERLGVVITFRPTTEPTSKLLQEAAQRAGTSVQLEPVVIPEAYDALLGGNPERHDELLLRVIDDLAASGVNGIVLAQVSMARLLPKLAGRVPVPVFSSLPSSLKRIRALLA
jgi:Asp/Glu/hydantoin racemase